MGAIEALALEVKELPERMVNALCVIRDLSGDRIVDLDARAISQQLSNVAEAIRGNEDPHG